MMATSITVDGPLLETGLGVGAGVSFGSLVVAGGAWVVLVVGLGRGGVDVVVVAFVVMVVLVVGLGDVVVVLVVG